MPGPFDDRSALALAMQWSARITTVSLEMVIPGFIGLWCDQRLGTRFLFAVIGFALGLIGGIWHLIEMTKPSKPRPGDNTNRPRDE